MRAGRAICLFILMCGLAILSPAFQAAAWPATAPGWAYASEVAPSAAATRKTSQARLLEVQSGSRSYLEGRGFRSYRQDRGFSGDRQFGGYPSGRDDGRTDRPYGLRRPRNYGPGDRCASWDRRCDRRWGGGNPDYYGCMRYHGCR